MNSTLSTTAWVLHDLGLATSVGGALFGKAGLHPAMRAMLEQEERGEIISEAWKQFTPINLVSHSAVVLTWLLGRSRLSGREIDRTTHQLVVAKDALIGLYLASGVAAVASGYAFDRSHHRKATLLPIGEGGVPASTTLDEPRKLQRASSVFGTINLVAGAALIGVTAVLAMQSGRSAKWSILSHWLP